MSDPNEEKVAKHLKEIYKRATQIEETILNLHSEAGPASLSRIDSSTNSSTGSKAGGTRVPDSPRALAQRP